MSETTEQITEAQLAATIDHAILKPEFTRDDVDEQLTIARDWKVFSVCVRPSDIAHAVQFLEGSGVAVGTVIGFVLGPLAEERLRSALMSTGGDFAPLLGRPIGMSLIIIALVVALWPVASALIRKSRKA